MDLTPPGSPAEGHIYLHDPTGETITYYKGSKTAVSKKPGGHTVQFDTPESLLDYLATLPSLQKTANSLSQTEMDIISDMAKTYGFKPTIDYLGPKNMGTPFIVILDKSGQRRFNIRKLANKFFFYKVVYKPNVVKGEVESVLHGSDWNTLIKEMHVQFATLAQPTMTVPSKDENVLSQTEMMAIAKLAKTYMLGTTQPIVTATDHPSIIIQGNMGSNIWEVRKAKGRYEVFNIINPQHLENVIDEPTFAEMLLKLNKLFEKYMTTPQAPEKMGVFEFSPKEASDIGQIASQFQLLTKGTTMTLEPDKHQVAGIEILNPDGKVAFHLHKDNETYRIYKVFDGTTKTWDLWYETKDAASFFQKLVFYLHGHTPGEPQPAEHNGITPEEGEQIKMEVEQYGPLFWTEYVKGSLGQTAYVEVFYKAEGNAPAYLVFSVGALGNYYQINDAQNKPKETSTTFEGIVARIHDRLAELSGQKSEPHQVSVPHKLLEEEQTEIAKIVSKYAPAITYEFTTADNIVIWIGNHITSYKVAKENDVYRVYTDKDSEWVIQNQTSTFNELTAYLDDMLAHIAKALASSKLDQPLPMTEPSALFPDMLSPSEVAAMKALIKKFKLPIATSYSKKLMEAKDAPKENNAYSLTISDPDHKVWIKITKKDGKYIFSKGLSDAYFPLKTFSAFSDLLYYADYFFNSYIKPELGEVEKITDDEVKMLKDLVLKYKVKGKVRRKYMTSNGQKVPYVFVELDDIGMKDYAIAKTAKGAYKLFEVDTLFEDWKNLAITDTWEGIYDIVSKVLNDEPVPEQDKYNQPVLNADQFEWLETFMKNQKPGVFIKKWGNGVIGGYDPSNKINGESNPLFVIRFAHDNPQNARILQVQTKDGGLDSDEYPFNTFEALAHFIVTNIEVVTQLLKGEIAPESKLADLMEKNGFKFHHDKTNVEIDGVNKQANVYENDKDDRIYLFSDGSSRVWYIDQSIGDVVSKDFKTIPELVDWMEGQYGDKAPADLKEIKEYLAYLGYKIEGHKSDKFSTVWVKEFGAEHQPGYDYIHLHADGTCKVNPSPLLGTGAPPSSAFFFNTIAGLKQYLSEKHTKGVNWINALFNQVLVEGKFQKISDQLTEMGFKWQTDQLTVVPFPSGGIMETTTDFTPQFKFSFESTYDLAKRIDLFNEGHNTAVADNGPSTGYTELNDLIKKAGFKFQGQEDTPDNGPKLVYMDGGGIKLVYYTDDESGAIKFPPTSGQGEKGIGFTTIEDLIDHLKKYNEPPATADTFAKNAGYAGLLKTLEKAGFEITAIKNAPDEQPYKVFKRSDGAQVMIWDTGVCVYTAASDKAQGEYSKNYVELDDKLKKLYEMSPSEEASILKYNPETQEIITKDLTGLVNPPTIESVHFQYNSNANGQGEIRVLGGNVLKFAIGKKIVGNNVLWYIRQKVADNPSGLYRVYTFIEHHKDQMVQWIKSNITALTTHKTVKDSNGDSMGSSEGPTVGVVPKKSATDIETGEQFVPSGETYKAHDIEGNADMIWLNEHDAALLQSLGFVPAPAENQYYKNSTGNIVKFFDTGKAEYIDYFGHPDKPENGEVVEFEDIPHTLKFMVAKHNSFPFSVHNYKSDDGTNVAEIPLNQHDNDMLKQLGFEWDVKGQKYIKLIGPKDTPKLHEAKKKKEDPNQMGLPFGGPLHPDKPTPPPEAPQNKFDVTEELVDLGFHPLASSGDELIYEKKDKKITHLVRWNKSENTIDYTAHKSGDSSVVTASWKEDAGVGLAHLAHIFTPKLTEQEFVVAKMEELGFKVLGGKPPEGAQSNTITFVRYTPKFVYDVIYHVDQKMMEFIKSNAKIKKGYHKIVEQWTLNVPDTIGKLENLFAFGSLGTIPAPTPKVPLVYVSVALLPDKEEILKKLGFNRLENDGVTWYEKAGEGQWVMFYGDGHANIKDKITGTEVDYFDTTAEAITFLSNKYFKTSKQKPKATGDMAYSGATYKVKDSHHSPTTLNPYDEAVLKSMGFEWVKKVKGYFKKLSDAVDEEFEVFDDGTSQWRTWTKHDLNDPHSISGTNPTKFSTVKEGMQFLWGKHMPFIEESFFKDLVNVLMTHPNAAKLLN